MAQIPLSRRIPSNSPRLLPEIDEKDRGKKCLVLDLDGTLIYQHRSKDRADVDIYFEILDPSLVRKMKCSATIGRY
jgi:predicted HAD superfamily phosphohydrolase YqeG